MGLELNRRGFLTAATLSASAVATGASVFAIESLPVEAAGWPKSALWRLPAHSGAIAWTVDDGKSYETVSKYIDFIEQSGIRLTFFVTTKYSSWLKVQPRLQPLVDSGQVQLGNHTMNHPNLTKLSAAQVQSELAGCQKFIQDHFGVESRPYFRPPYGYLNETVIKAAADIGYTKPVLWLGSLGDSTPISAPALLKLANTWMTEDRLLIGHANQPTVTHLYGQLLGILQKRHLKTVTIKDVFG